ncbi:hypothetical protein BJH44_004281 [Salmonella enterica subsp. enterica serovar Bredeney]|uniref:hypothetical protein n=1 Tax=Salmonella enterica TaxID=28901 RepID=UPI0009ADD491|nr:hypothetical protein [Salmonella enterica]EDV7203295.1 hypothetical protein [Salmonella enterica subsp. enterica serovar Bredeney]
MRLNSKLSTLLMVGGAFFLVQSVKAVSVVDSATIPITINTVAIPCTVDVPSIVDLFVIARGKEVAYPPFEIKIKCSNAIKTEVYAQSLTHIVGDSGKRRIKMDGPSNFVHLFMEYDGTVIKLDGDANTTDSGFCVGSYSRTCQLTPRTWSSPEKTIPGDYSAMVRFNVRYKA